MFYEIIIKEGKEKQLIKHHPWVFSGAIKSVSPTYSSPSLAKVYEEDGSFIAWGYYDEESHIILHLLSWNKENFGESYIKELIRNAIYRREDFFSLEKTNAFRLIHGEADFLPGLAVDAYGDELKVIISSRFAQHFLFLIINTLEEVLSPSLIQVTPDAQYSRIENIGEEVSYYKNGEELKDFKNEGNTAFFESGLYFECPRGKSQKSGFYLDQRENRNIVEKYSKDKVILDAFSYTGAFSLHALRNEAKSVTALDSSESALRHLLYQVNVNEEKGLIPSSSREKIKIVTENAFSTLRNIEKNRFDLIILDPPKLAKTKGELEKAIKAYKDLNRVAMLKIKNEGIIASFSCSSALTRENFRTVLAWAAADANVELQILETLGQPKDHPIRASFPESEYLKGFIFRVLKS